MVAIARLGAAESLAAGHHDDRRLQLLGRRRDRADELGCGRSSISRSSASDPDEAEARFADLRARVAETELVRIGISPHAPYTCSLDVYRYCLSLGIPVGTHLAESDGENEWLEHGTGPLSAAADVLVAPTGKRAVGNARRGARPGAALRPLRRGRRGRDRRSSRRPTCRSRTARARTRCSAAASRR